MRVGFVKGTITERGMAAHRHYVYVIPSRPTYSRQGGYAYYHTIKMFARSRRCLISRDTQCHIKLSRCELLAHG